MDKHTSGPWTAHHGWAHDGRPLPQHPDWCEVLGGSFEHGDYMSICGHFGMANARLIAASPDLLKALQELLEAVETDCRDLPSHVCEAIVEDAKMRAREAIAKTKEPAR